MQEHLAESIPVRRLADLVNLSPSRFRALFVAQIGCSPAAYLQRLRLRRARLLIARTFLSVREVMRLVGYNDPSHFARDFRRMHGAPPSAFKAEGIATLMGDDAAPSVDSPTDSRIGPSHARRRAIEP